MGLLTVLFFIGKFFYAELFDSRLNSVESLLFEDIIGCFIAIGRLHCVFQKLLRKKFGVRKEYKNKNKV